MIVLDAVSKLAREGALEDGQILGIGHGFADVELTLQLVNALLSQQHVVDLFQLEAIQHLVTFSERIPYHSNKTKKNQVIYKLRTERAGAKAEVEISMAIFHFPSQTKTINTLRSMHTARAYPHCMYTNTL